MRKRKNGSSLVLMIAIMAIVSLLGITMVGAINYTTKLNVNEKEMNDLLYASESGVDQAISNIDNLKYFSSSVGVVDRVNISREVTTKFTSKNIAVNIVVEKLADLQRYKVTSEAVNNITLRTKTTEAVIKKNYTMTGGGNSLLKYSMCAKNLNVYYTAPINPDFTLINGENTPYLKYVGPGAELAPPAANIDKSNFLLPEFNFTRLSSTITVTSFQDLINNSNSTGSNGIKKVEYTVRTHPHTGVKIEIYLINAPRLDIKLDNATGISLSNKVFICSGDINIYPKNIESKLDSSGKVKESSLPIVEGLPTFNLDSSTIIGSNVNLYVSSCTLTKPIYKSGDGGHVINSQVDLDAINSIIESNCVNWSSGSGTPSIPIWGPTEVTYY